jgi:Mor family transcriptional regulator
MGWFSDDIVADILQRVVEAAANSSGGGFSESLASTIEKQVRADWGGSRPYVQRDRESLRIERDDKILAAWSEGQHDIQMLATRYGISVRQVRRIVKG